MSEAFKVTPSLRSMLERIEWNSGTLLMLAVTANKLRDAGRRQMRASHCEGRRMAG